MSVDDSETLSQKNDQEFLLWLYQEFGRLMFFTAQKYVTAPEEIVQESLRKLIEKVSLLRKLKRPSLCSYTVTTVRHTAIDFLKAQGRAKEYLVKLEEALQEAVLWEDSLEETLIFREQVRCLKKIWPLLDEESRLLLEYKYILGYDNEELGRLLGCRTDSVRMKLTRARRKVIGLMEEGRRACEKS